MSRITEIKQRLTELENRRFVYEQHCQEIIDNIAPCRQNFRNMTPVGAKKMQNIYDGSPEHCWRMFANGMASWMVNEALKWFKVKPEDEDLERSREVKGWLEYVERLFYFVFAKSNFYAADHEAYLDEGAFGMSCGFIGEHPKWRVYFETLNLGQCFVAEDQYGQRDTLYRQFDWPARKLVQKFGLERVSPKVQGYLETNKPDTMVTVVHAVQPRADRIYGQRDSRNLPYESLYLEKDNDHLLEEGGFREFPYWVSRHSVAFGEVYGRGPGATALPFAKELHQKKSDTLLAGERRLFPALLLPNDGYIAMPIKLTRNGINFINAEGSMQDRIGKFPGPEGPLYEIAEIQDSREQISLIFHNDLFLMAMQKEMTATEFMQLVQEKMRLLGPYVGRLTTERYNPIFDRVFNILWDQGLIPEPPPELRQAGGGLKVLYDSPLAKSQRASEAQGIQEVTGYAGNVAQIYPPILDIYDFDEMGREFAEIKGLSMKLVKDAKQVEAIRQARAEQARQQQMAAAALEAAKAMPALNQGPEPGSPMAQINQGMQRGAGLVQ